MQIKRYGRLVVRTLKVFDDVDRADGWLRSPNKSLDGRTPLEAMRTSEGAEKVEKQLNRLADTHI